MSMKRQSQDDSKSRLDAGSSEDKRRRSLPSLSSVITEVMNMSKVQHFMEPVLEPLIRKVVKEEVELALRKYMTTIKRNCGKDVFACELRSLKLKFLDLISPPVFTGTRIEGEESSLKVALVDVLTGEVVCSGPESCAKVEIVVLEGDFDGDDGDNWTADEFKNNIVREREGKKPLLTGDAFLYLKEGIGWLSDISFTDNSSWTRSRKFRLGARIVDSFEGISVREAKTESFIVRDHRGELYKKHHPPSLSDEVWRLEKIGKDGAFHRRLSKERVNTVKDFLTLLYLDPTRLRNVSALHLSYIYKWT
uniref:Calmodulin binding protein n=1 Tax=Solanum tuberosum TaxID=4113 RepID=M1C9Q1_SOLTU